MDWIDELELRVGPPDAAMGTHALDLACWLRVDDDWCAQRERARALLEERRRDVLATTPATHDAAVELGALLDTWLVERHPEVVDDEHLLETDPLAAARRRVAEDLCLLTPSPAGWLLAAGAVCFPSYWALREKVGRPLLDVHQPVPGYAGPLATRVDRFLGRLRPGQAVWRRNWSIHDSADLYVPVHVDGGTSERWLRSELQTLLRLPASEAVVFTIRTQQVPLAALAGRPDRCAALAASLRAWSPAVRSYKGAAVGAAVLRWLDERS